MPDTPDNQSSARKRRPFRVVAIASGLVTSDDVDAAEAVARGRLANQGRGQGPPEDDAGRGLDAATATVLVEQGRLTPFQAREIRAGRARFRLGQYTVIDEIGRGGMGQVFKAEHALMGRHVAVKVLPRSKATPESEAAFRREMRILGRLDHENLVRAFDAGYDAMVYYLVTELVPGLDLRRQVHKFGPLDVTAAASVFTQVARALAFAHAERLVHRDVKPGNILVMDDGRAKLLDLGLAGSTLEAEALRLGRVVGTMDYIAPEQIRTPDDVGPSADIYALGCTLYFALTGHVPFPGGGRKDKMRRHLTESPAPIQRLAPQLPPAVCQLVEAMMAKSVTDRIATADEVIQRLARWTPERPTPLPRRPRGDVQPPVADAEASGEGELPVLEPVWPIVEESVSGGEPARRTSASGAMASGRRSVLEAALVEAGVPTAVVTAVQVLAPAALVGVGCAVVAALLGVMGPSVFGDVSPAACGGVAFFLTAAIQSASRLRRLVR